MKVSHDLRTFLATSTVARSTPSSSDTVFFDWSMCDVSDSCDTTVAAHGSQHTIESISQYGLTLSEPYGGPLVQVGQPRVYIRTNLLPRGSNNIGSHKHASGDSKGHVIRNIELPVEHQENDITALCVHPYLQHVIVGIADDSVLILE